MDEKENEMSLSYAEMYLEMMENIISDEIIDDMSIDQLHGAFLNVLECFDDIAFFHYSTVPVGDNVLADSLTIELQDNILFHDIEMLERFLDIFEKMADILNLFVSIYMADGTAHIEQRYNDNNYPEDDLWAITQHHSLLTYKYDANILKIIKDFLKKKYYRNLVFIAPERNPAN